MESLEWRVKKLENTILGAQAGGPHFDRLTRTSDDQPPILDQLNVIAKHYRSHLDGSGKDYARFVELYDKYRGLTGELVDNSPESRAAKVELILAYEDELLKYMGDLKDMAEKADRVLAVEKWPDLGGLEGRLGKLSTINRDQHVQSVALNQRTEELIEIYNEIIGSFKSNISTWNQVLESHENEEKRQDED